MKRVFPALVLSLMMIAPLAACTARPSGSGANNSAAGTNDGTGTNSSAGSSVTDNAAGSRSRMGGTGGDTGSSANGTGSAFSNGRYFADDSGDVRDGNHTTIGDDMRKMTDDVMDGVRRAGDSVGNAINDMTHN